MLAHVLRIRLLCPFETRYSMYFASSNALCASVHGRVVLAIAAGSHTFYLFIVAILLSRAFLHQSIRPRAHTISFEVNIRGSSKLARRS